MVVSVPQASGLLAQATGWWEMGRRFREGGPALEPANLLIFLAVVAAGTFLFWLLAKFLQRDNKRSFHGPRRLFWELCREHDLNLFDRWLLWRLAAAQRLPQPACVFVDANCFASEQIPHRLKRKKMQLQRIHQKLFAG